ncbi:MAG: DUF3782 domain-containing protein [bacterium]|nr:DUF3782 domain-containing protein [bacterium]
MTDQELKDLVASLAVSQKALSASQAKTDEQIEKMGKRIDAVGKQLGGLGKQLGGLGEKFGGFTEGMAFPSMEKILRNQFKMNAVSTNVKARKKGENMELDVLAVNSDSIYIVEVKSHLKEDGLEQIEKILHRFFDFFPYHKGKKLYGILAVVDAPGELRKRVIKKGIYLARIQDDIFKIQVPASFTPRAH